VKQRIHQSFDEELKFVEKWLSKPKIVEEGEEKIEDRKVKHDEEILTNEEW